MGKIRGQSAKIAMALCAVALLLGGGRANAQSSPGTPALSQEGPFSLDWSTVDTGGAISEGGGFAIQHTAGQPDARVLDRASYSLSGGFWGYSVEQVTPSLTPTPSRTPTGPTATPTTTPTGPTPTVPVTTPTSTPTATSTGPTPTGPTPTPGCSPDYDLNEDGHIDAADLLLFIRHTHGGDLRSDFNCDGGVDAADLFLFSQHWARDE